MKNNSEKLLLIISIIFIILGVGIFLYPSISNYLAEKNHIDIIRNYDDLIVKIDEEKINEEKEKAKIYNENLSGDPVHDPFVIGSGYALPENYKEVLNIAGDSVMGYVEIPKISVYLPIYHGTSDEVLEKGVGHIQNTSVPIGGKSTHSVLTGHTGLPNAELFTRLDELGIGDIFYIHVLDDVLTYKVFETKVILPDKIDELQILNGKDYITLVTCTPYGVNSHRLLVKAERVEYEEYSVTKSTTDEEGTDTKKESPSKHYYLTGTQIGIVLLVLILTIVSIIGISIRRKKNLYRIKK